MGKTHIITTGHRKQDKIITGQNVPKPNCCPKKKNEKKGIR